MNVGCLLLKFHDKVNVLIWLILNHPAWYDVVGVIIIISYFMLVFILRFRIIGIMSNCFLVKSCLWPTRRTNFLLFKLLLIFPLNCMNWVVKSCLINFANWSFLPYIILVWFHTCLIIMVKVLLIDLCFSFI